MATKLLQANVNHSAGAQDLLLQALAERNGGLALVSEPHHIPERDSRWLGLRREHPGAAIYWRPGEESPRPKLIRAERYIVAAKWGTMRVVFVYAPPRSREWSRARFGSFLEQVGRVLDECAPHPVIVAGDFNSHAREWGSRRTDPRGQDLLEWAATRGLFLINTGSVSTCVRPQGESIVDLTFGNRPAVRAVRGWREAIETDINSDHLLIEMSVVATSKEVLCRHREGAGSRPPRWALRRLDEDALKASVSPSRAEAIVRAKAQAWQRLLEELDRDPWRRPYRIVLGRLTWAPPATDDLDPQALDNVVGTLFPTAGPEPLPYEGPPPGWKSRLGVTEPELAAAAKRLGGKSKAPGPDGVPGRVWALALKELSPRLRRLFTDCLRAGVFPSRWKRARLVLLPKEGRPAEGPSAYRPICLLDEVGKLFERVEAAMRFHRFPPYLVHIIRDYFRERKLEFSNAAGLQCGRAMYCGVPQGSVLGPLLWNLA
ncbi:uncharacterized protein LOC116852181 [Odontomachus brunneus]|uniref:uncharacterized protein LOC116852181 n=1 Tax=Odontomachus brunneus TaxID=486640 RepID=UPI0013F2438A|nr:uncharacterized protein LOC116852181 [Odontomachus brunneus]